MSMHLLIRTWNDLSKNACHNVHVGPKFQQHKIAYNRVPLNLSLRLEFGPRIQTVRCLRGFPAITRLQKQLEKKSTQTNWESAATSVICFLAAIRDQLLHLHCTHALIREPSIKSNTLVGLYIIGCKFEFQGFMCRS